MIDESQVFGDNFNEFHVFIDRARPRASGTWLEPSSLGQYELVLLDHMS